MIYFESDMSVEMKHMWGRDVDGGCWPSRKLRAHDVSCAVGLIPLGSETMAMVCVSVGRALSYLPLILSQRRVLMVKGRVPWSRIIKTLSQHLIIAPKHLMI